MPSIIHRLFSFPPTKSRGNENQRTRLDVNLNQADASFKSAAAEPLKIQKGEWYLGLHNRQSEVWLSRRQAISLYLQPRPLMGRLQKRGSRRSSKDYFLVYDCLCPVGTAEWHEPRTVVQIFSKNAIACPYIYCYHFQPC